MIGKVRSLGLIACLWVLLPGCIIRQKSEGFVRFRVTDAQDHVVPQFLLLRDQKEQRWHFYSDPDEGHWLPPKLTHLLFLSGDDGEFTDSFYFIRGFSLLPPTGIVSATDRDFRVYSAGLEVGRSPVSSRQRREPSPGIEFRYVLQPPNNAIHTDRGKSYAQWIIAELEDDNLWSQVKTRWAKGEGKRAIRYLCKYYLDRFHGIRAASPKWVPSERCLSVVAWLESVSLSGNQADSDD